jgi:hypothetical protein
LERLISVGGMRAVISIYIYKKHAVKPSLGGSILNQLFRLLGFGVIKHKAFLKETQSEKKLTR